VVIVVLILIVKINFKLKIMNKLIAMGYGIALTHQVAVEGLKQKAIDEYRAALKMPRKKKKQAKKSALLLWSIACWEPEYTF
jgi:hypothetical protein